MIKKIYGNPYCNKCKKAREKFPYAKYIDITEMSKEDIETLIKRIIKDKNNVLLELPIFENEKDEIV